MNFETWSPESETPYSRSIRTRSRRLCVGVVRGNIQWRAERAEWVETARAVARAFEEACNLNRCQRQFVAPTLCC